MKIVYQAEDGKIFETEKECFTHEKNLKKIKGVAFYSISNYEDEEINISDSVWELIVEGDYDKIMNKIFYSGECDYIAFKNKEVLKNFLSLGKKYLGINLSSYMSIDYVLKTDEYRENENIVFYCLELFSDFFPENYESFVFVDKKTLFNEMKRVMKQMIGAEKRIFENL